MLLTLRPAWIWVKWPCYRASRGTQLLRRERTTRCPGWELLRLTISPTTTSLVTLILKFKFSWSRLQNIIFVRFVLGFTWVYLKATFVGVLLRRYDVHSPKRNGDFWILSWGFSICMLYLLLPQECDETLLCSYKMLLLCTILIWALMSQPEYSWYGYSYLRPSTRWYLGISWPFETVTAAKAAGNLVYVCYQSQGLHNKSVYISPGTVRQAESQHKVVLERHTASVFPPI